MVSRVIEEKQGRIHLTPCTSLEPFLETQNNYLYIYFWTGEEVTWKPFKKKSKILTKF